MNRLIGFVGFASAGKDTVANFLMDDFHYRAVAFADSIKDCLASIFQWDRELLEGATPSSRKWRDEVDGWWAEKLGIPNFTPRWAMTHFGTDVMRCHFDSSIWILNTERRLIGMENLPILVKDCRFPNEIDMLRRKKASIVRVRRGPDPAWYGIAEHANKGCAVALATMNKMDIHESEWRWIGTKVDYLIDNDGSISDLAEKVREMIVCV